MGYTERSSDWRSDIAGGESARVLADRYGVTMRTIHRWRAALRREGVRVRVPDWRAA